MMQSIRDGLSSFTALLLIAALACLNLAAAAAKPPATKPPAAKPPALKESFNKSLPAKTVANPHLHNAKAAVAKSTTNSKLAKHWQGRWSFADWAVVHRGTGTVMGQVYSASGTPVAGAQVVLRKSNGGIFKSVASKHITHSSAGGTFIMRHVRIGSYRVRASKVKANGHVGIRLHGGHTAMAMVKL
jgi:hypothetical protein